MSKREKRSPRGRDDLRWCAGTVPHGVWLLVSIITAACFVDSDSHDGAGGASGLQTLEPQAVAAPQQSTTLMSAGLRAATIESVQNNAGEAYRFEASADGTEVVGSNAAQRLTARLADGAMRVHPATDEPAWSLELRWTGIGRGSDIRPVNAPLAGADVVDIRASYRYADGSEEGYLNGPLGIEQGFALEQRPAGERGELVVEVGVGGLVPQLAPDGTRVSLLTAEGEPVLRYTDLYVRDAAGRPLPARLAAEADAIQLRIADAEARYPLAVDPLIWVEQQELLASDGAANDWFGYSAVSISGDTAIVTAVFHDHLGSNSGSAYVFVLKKTDGEPCTFGSECVSGNCVDGVCCDVAACPGDCFACDVPGSEGSCDFESNATLCRVGSGDLCDVDEYCTGSNANCPGDTVAPNTTVCRTGSGDVCDPDETCTGKEPVARAASFARQAVL